MSAWASAPGKHPLLLIRMLRRLGDIGKQITYDQTNIGLHHLGKKLFGKPKTMSSRNKTPKRTSKATTSASARRVKRAAASAGAKAGKKAAKRATGNRRPRKAKHNNRKPIPARNRYGRPAGTQAKRGFSMDRACFKGRDYVSSLVMTGNDASTALEGPGQVIYKVQLQPWKLVSNGRLARCMALFEKWRPRNLTFRLRSSQPPGLNGGTVLMVYEPKVNEKMPDVTIGSHNPDRAALSRYENHTNAKILQMNPNKGQTDGNTDFSVNTKLQIGPYGGWFNYDSDGTSTLAESSAGQIMIMIQQPMNCRGSSGTYSSASGVGGIDWADLILDYEIECSVANDEPVADGPAGSTTAQGQVVLSSGANYVSHGFTSGPGAFSFLSNYNSSDWAAPHDGFPSTAWSNKVQFNFSGSSNLNFYIPYVSGNGLLAILKIKLAALADAGTTRAGYQAATCFTYDNQGANAGTVYTAGVTNVTSMPANQTLLFLCPASRDTSLAQLGYLINLGNWTTGTGGSSTASTTGALADWYFIEIPDEWNETRMPALHQSLLKLLERSGEHVPEAELRQLFPKVEAKTPEGTGDRAPIPVTTTTLPKAITAPRETKSLPADGPDDDFDDWDSTDEKRHDAPTSPPPVRFFSRHAKIDTDDHKAGDKPSRPSSTKSSKERDRASLC